MVNLSSEERDRLVKEIQNFFEEERDEKIGIIASGKVLDFFLENLGNQIYNKALDDARVWFTKRMEDISIDFDLLYK
jgi:uncharacterized protein (DUF2164 family)